MVPSEQHIASKGLFFEINILCFDNFHKNTQKNRLT